MSRGCSMMLNDFLFVPLQTKCQRTDARVSDPNVVDCRINCWGREAKMEPPQENAVNKSHCSKEKAHLLDKSSSRNNSGFRFHAGSQTIWNVLSFKMFCWGNK